MLGARSYELKVVPSDLGLMKLFLNSLVANTYRVDHRRYSFAFTYQRRNCQNDAPGSQIC